MSTVVKVRSLLLITVLAWLGVIVIINATDPVGIPSRIFLFLLLYVATTGSLTLIGFYSSYRLFSSSTYRGNLGRALQQGGLWAAFFVVALAMQMNRSLSPLTTLMLLAFFIIASVIVLTRKQAR